MRQYLLFLSFLLLSAVGLRAQEIPLSNLRIMRLAPGTEAVLLDTLSLIPESLEVRNPQDSSLIAPENYVLRDKTLYWKKLDQPPLSQISEVEVRYRVFPFDLRKSYSHLDSNNIQPTPDGTYADFNYTPYELGDELISFKGLQYDGSYTNGLSFGNSQSLVVNSNFNLRMAGTLGDDIEVVAAISDQNIPLQPEGNTQQLQEFDKIFIQLKRKKSMLIAGDYELARPKSYFMNYFKKLQGASLSNSLELGKGNLSTKLSAAIARGKFARNTLVQQEGNQGPYRLQGNEGETFIIILAGTEKVYLDGTLLKRGLEADYVIDYNRGDVTFTNRRLITKDSRVIVEFEYNDQNYLRSLMAFNTEYQSDKWRLYFNLYTEQDSKTSGSAADLDSLERVTLRDAGDRLERSVTSGIDTIAEYSPFRVSYKMVDTVFTCGNDLEKILVYTTNADSAQYTASFLLVGPGMGDYDLDTDNAANGRVYVWVAPDPLTCARRGAYMPQIRLIPPEQKQLFTLGAEYQVSKNSKLLAEVALSNKDPNRFSTLDEQDDQGLASIITYDFQKKLGKKDSKWLLNTNLNYEFVQANFEALNPYRPAEFTRDWNLRTAAADTLKNDQHLASAGLSIARADLGKVAYDFGTFMQGSIYNGLRHGALVEFRKKGFQLNASGSFLTSKETDTDSRFFRPRAELSKSFEKLGGWTLGVYGEQEKNSRRDLQSDTLNANSFHYDLWRVFLKSKSNEKINVEFSYGQRYDYAPTGKNFTQSTKADDLNIQGNWKQGKASRLSWNLNYRQLSIADTTLSQLDPQETFLGRLEHHLKLFKGFVLSTTNYEIGGGQEPLIEYRYLEVPRGEGVYFWDAENADFNGDGVPQVNEIQEAPFADQANIIRVTLFTNQFIRTNKTQLNQSLRLEPKVLWHQEKGWKKWLSKWSTQSTFLINRRTREAEGVSPWNPFQLNISDTALVALNYSIQNSLFFKPNSTKYNFQLGKKNQRNRLILTTGYQSLTLDEQFFKARWNKSSKFSTDLEAAIGQRDNDFQLFNQQDYSIAFFRVAPSVTYRPSNSFRAQIKYRWEEGENQLPDTGEKAVQHDISLETTYNKAATTAIRFNFSFVDVQYTGTRNSPVELALLQGLKDGKNFLWDLTLSRSISKNLTLRISYNGRKTGVSRTVHIGSMEVGARF